MSDASNVLMFPNAHTVSEQAALQQFIASFEALPDAYQTLLVNMLVDRLPPAYGRATAAMLAQRYPELPQPETT